MKLALSSVHFLPCFAPYFVDTLLAMMVKITQRNYKIMVFPSTHSSTTMMNVRVVSAYNTASFSKFSEYFVLCFGWFSHDMIQDIAAYDVQFEPAHHANLLSHHGLFSSLALHMRKQNHASHRTGTCRQRCSLS